MKLVQHVRRHSKRCTEGHAVALIVKDAAPNMAWTSNKGLSLNLGAGYYLSEMKADEALRLADQLRDYATRYPNPPTGP